MTDTEELGLWSSGAGVHVRRRVRLLMLLDASDYAGISPISTSRLHAFAYLADILSPIYDFSTLSGVVLKRRSGPYFPDLQWELDRLVGLGLIEVTEFRPVVDVAQAYLDASFCLRRQAAEPILRVVHEISEFHRLREFFRELGGALGAVAEDDLDATTQADVTWETGISGSIIDYAQWRSANYSELAVERIDEIARGRVGYAGIKLSPGAKVNLYVHYLRRAANG